MSICIKLHATFRVLNTTDQKTLFIYLFIYLYQGCPNFTFNGARLYLITVS